MVKTDKYFKIIEDESIELVNQPLPKILDKLPHLSFHGLRHTAVSNMIAGGVDLITAGDIAGHSQKSTTANIYAHAIENNKKAASNALEINLLKRRNG